MPYIYNSSALLSASVSDNLQPITPPVVNRFFMPWGIELQAVSTTGNQARHFPIPGLLYIPIKMASTVSVDRVGLTFVDANGCTDTWYYDVSLYTHNSTDNYPATKIADLGTLTYEPGVTPNSAQLITIAQTLNANTTYWVALGIRNNAVFPGADVLAGRTPWVYQQQGDFSLFRKRGMALPNSGAPGIAWLESPQTYSGTRPATTTFASNASSAGVIPRLAFRRSA